MAMAFEKWIVIILLLIVLWLITFLFLVANQKKKPMITEGSTGFIFFLPYAIAAVFIADTPLFLVVLVNWFFRLTIGDFFITFGVWAWILIFFNKKISLVVEKFL